MSKSRNVFDIVLKAVFCATTVLAMGLAAMCSREHAGPDVGGPEVEDGTVGAGAEAKVEGATVEPVP